MNSPVIFTKIEPLYTKTNGVYVQEIDRTDLPLGFIPSVRHLVTVPGGAISANHRHPRMEAFIGIGNNLEFFWVDEDGATHSKMMNQDNQLLLVVVLPNIPHAIRNNSDTQAVLLEYADMPQNEVDITQYSIV